jgi:hypothetical protein
MKPLTSGAYGAISLSILSRPIVVVIVVVVVVDVIVAVAVAAFAVVFVVGLSIHLGKNLLT